MSNYTAVPTAELESWQEAREQEMLNKCIRENVARKERAHMAGQARIKEIEAEEDAKRECFWTLVHTVVGTVVILAGIYFLRGIGAMHDALAETFALITAFGAGKIIGGCRE